MPKLRLPTLINGLVTLVLLASCTPAGIATLQQDITLAAQDQLKRTLANHYTRELGKGVNLAMNDLAQVGGYLDNPLVRILLPPPLSIALGIAKDLQANPQAAILEILMNRAAEQIVPGAAPILQTAVAQITPAEARALLEGGSSAGSDFLKAKTSEQLRATLTPQISQQLNGNGAQEIYSSLLASTLTTPPATPELGTYVTDKTLDGLFKNLGTQEAKLRENLDAATGGLLPSTVKPATVEPATIDTAPAAPVEAAPVESAPVDAAPVETAPVDAAPVDAAPVETAPADATPVETAPADAAPVDATSVDATSVETAPKKPAPMEPLPKTPTQEITNPEDPGSAPNTEAAPLDQIWM